MEHIVEVHVPENMNIHTRLQECDEWCKDNYQTYRSESSRCSWKRQWSDVRKGTLCYRFQNNERMAAIFKLRFG